MAGGRDPRSLVHAETDVPLAAHARLAGVQAHAHSERHVLGPGVGDKIALRVDGGRDCVLRPPEGDEEGIPLRVHLAAAVGGERGPENTLMLGKRIAVERTELPQQTCRTLDVCEQKRDGAARKLDHDHSSLPQAERKRKRRAPVCARSEGGRYRARTSDPSLSK